MQVKLIAILFAVLMLSGLAMAAAPTVAVLNRDGNFYYPSKTTVINWTVSDADVPLLDVNMRIWYVNQGTTVRTEITDAAAGDLNATNYCSSPITGTAQICSLTWVLPTGLDANYYWDVNVIDTINSDDANSESGSVIFDSNACDTQYSVVSDQVTLTTFCTGWGTDANAGSEATYFGYSRVGKCPDRFNQYSSPFDLSFGEFIICYYSTDGLGNTEITQSNIHTASSSAFNLALLAELLLAALILMTILGAVVLRGEGLNANMMIALILAAVVIVISIYIYAVIL